MNVLYPNKFFHNFIISISLIHCPYYNHIQVFQGLYTYILTAAASANTLDLDFLVVKDSPETSISKSGGKIIFER